MVLVSFAWTGLVAACGGQEATPTPAPAPPPAVTAAPVATPTASPTNAPEPTATTRPANTPVATPTLGPTPPPPATRVPADTRRPPPTSVASNAPAPTDTPAPTPAPTETPIPVSSELTLEITSPAEDQTVTSESVTVAGFASPDATVSVNGNLVIPSTDGSFSIELTITPGNNPFLIEVIATSLAGEQQSVVRTVILVP